MILAGPPATPVQRKRPLSSTVPGVTEPDATGPCPAAIGPRDAPPHAGQVVRRVLLRRNIVIDAETAQLVAAAVQGPETAERPMALASWRGEFTVIQRSVTGGPHEPAL